MSCSQCFVSLCLCFSLEAPLTISLNENFKITLHLAEGSKLKKRANAQGQQPSEDLGKGKAWQIHRGQFWQLQNGPLTSAPEHHLAVLELCHMAQGKQVRPLILFSSPGVDTPQEKDIIFGVNGSSVTIDCRYDPAKNYTLKYLCKWRKTGCHWIITNNGLQSMSFEGRVAMFDNPENGTFSIILNQLSSSDEGFYWCMTDDHGERKTTRELKIIEGMNP